MNPIEVIAEYYRPASRSYDILIRHGERVSRKALAVAEKVAHLNPDFKFIHEAAMLHDIGMFQTDVKQLGCFGRHPYVVHGVLGRAILEQIGLQRHALVCERHVGVGLTAEDIRVNRLPLPIRDMLPVTIEEKAVCFADKFYSKGDADDTAEKEISAVVGHIRRYGQDKVERFLSWAAFFGQT